MSAEKKVRDRRRQKREREVADGVRVEDARVQRPASARVESASRKPGEKRG